MHDRRITVDGGKHVAVRFAANGTSWTALTSMGLPAANDKRLCAVLAIDGAGKLIVSCTLAEQAVFRSLP